MMYRKIEGYDYDFVGSFMEVMTDLREGLIDIDEAKCIIEETLEIALIQCEERSESVFLWYGLAVSWIESL